MRFKFINSLIKLAATTAVENLTLSSMTKAGESLGELIGRKINPLWTALREDKEEESEDEEEENTGP